MANTYMDTRTGQAVTAMVLFDMKGYPRDEAKLKELGVYPIRYDYLEYDSITQTMLPDGDPVFSEEDQCFVQSFKIEDLAPEIIEQNRQAAARMADETRREEILKRLDELDVKSARGSRAVALALADGDTADAADIAKLKEIEDEAQLLRIELSEINGRLNPVEPTAE